jgi:8-oxo-dGTP diphosphatase
VDGFGSRSLIRFGAGPAARRAAHRRADHLWADGTPARAFFAVEFGGWVVAVYPRFPESHVIAAAGGAAWRVGGDGVEVGLVHRPRYDDWSLPKGKLRADESTVVGAHREVAEEIGCEVVVGRRLPSRQYDTSRGPKTVAYWSMRVRAARPTASDEVDRVDWVGVTEARRRLTYPGDAAVLDALGDPRDTTTLLLVRHASAGDPERWSDDDTLRPLDEHGQRQARTLDRVLLLFGVTRVASVPNRRCRDTVAGLAAALGVSVVDEPALEENAYAGDRDTARRRVQALATADGTWALCSQGDVIPDLVQRLADADGLQLGEVRAKKGSAWALFFTEGRLVVADYYPDFR